MTTETAVADLYAHLINELIEVEKQNEVWREQQRKQEEATRGARAEERKRTLYALIERAQNTLDSLCAASPRFAELINMEWPHHATDQAGYVLPLFSAVVSPSSVIGCICLQRYFGGGVGIKILFQRVREAVLREDENFLHRVPETFDEKLQVLTEPQAMIARVVAVLLPHL